VLTSYSYKVVYWLRNPVTECDSFALFYGSRYYLATCMKT